MQTKQIHAASTVANKQNRVAMQRSCASCGRSYQAKRATSKYCGSTCRTRVSRAGSSTATVAAQSPTGGLAAATKRELEDAECLDTMLGWASIELARRIESSDESGSSVASMVKVLRETMTDALKGTTVADPLDELRDRRDAKRSAG